MAGCVYPAFPMLFPYPWASRNEERELGRRGVVGLDEGLGREDDRGASMSVMCFRMRWCIGERQWANNNRALLLRNRWVVRVMLYVEWVVFGIVDLPPGKISHATTFYTCNFEMRSGLYKI